MASPEIRQDVLRDQRYPVHKIADTLLPYLQVLLDQFHPEQIILFGSYAYGHPEKDSDVDLLVIKESSHSPLQEKILIRQAWWQVPRKEALPAFDLIVVSPDRHKERLDGAGAFYNTIVSQGLALL